jgi:tRNA-dihydrouridine synthase
MTHTLISSPLQGFTDYRFRNAFNKYFGGIDTYYAPYIRLNGKMVIKAVYERDLQLKHNKAIEVIPQVMTCNAEEFLFVIKYVQSLGYTELNWNLGCPYPMVINRGMGSGLISDPNKIDHILKRAHEETDITISMKMRMGYDNCHEILDTFPILEKYPIKNISIHARIGKQLYEGGVDLEGFQRCLDTSAQKIYYNGDITSVERFREMTNRFPSIDHWLIGRGLIADPFLPQMIKDNTTEYPEDRWEIFSKFHDTLFSEYEQKLSGAKHVIMKMVSYWEYFSQPLPNPKKIVKMVKKTKTIEDYDSAVAQIFEMVRQD